MKKEESPIIVEETFDRSISDVWKAITDINEMIKWYFNNIPDFKPETGFETEFNVDAGERSFLHQWKITEVIPEKKIKYNWKYKEYPGDSYVTFELSEENGGTRLTLTHEVTEDFPDSVPEFTRESCQGGWNYFIGESLEGYLDKK